MVGQERGIQGYEPFGSLLPGRNYNSGSYSNLFQGQVHDDEIYGATGTSYAFEYRMHDPRVGRFWSLDPLAAKYPHNSPYAFSENRVIDGFELEGLEVVKLNEGGSVGGPYANSEQALGAALDGKGLDGAGSATIDLDPLVVSGRSGASDYGGNMTSDNVGSSMPKQTESKYAEREPLAHAVTGLALEGASHGVGNTTFRLFNKSGKNFSPKLYDGWKGGSAGQIKTYGLGKVIGHAGKGLGYYGLLNSALDLGTGDVPPLEGSMDLIMGGAGTFGGWIGGTFDVSYQAGKLIGPSKWYGKDDSKWFE